MTNLRVKALIQQMTIIVDTREQENQNIISFFNKNNVSYIKRKLEFGDYSFIAPEMIEFGISEPVSFENRIAIERKAHLTELSGNLAQSRERFERELQRSQEAKAKLILMVENGSWSEIIEHKYETDLSEKSYLASLFSFTHRYNLDIQFIERKHAGMFIYSQFCYMLREEIKQLVGVKT